MAQVLIGGTASGVGKTTIATGLMAAMTEAGYEVQPYKVGPDYIDPGFHTAATNRHSRNLDSWMIPHQQLKELFLQSSQGVDLAIIEGVMGLFDGHRSDQPSGSSAEVAKLLSAPVILVVDAKKLAQSGAAMVYGYQHYDEQLTIGGVILNRIGSARHYQIVKEEIAKLGIPVLGYLPTNLELELPERHLGLVPSVETAGLDSYLEQLAELMQEQIDLDQVYELAQQAGEVPAEDNLFQGRTGERKIKLAVAYDQAFNFYYQDNLDLLADRGVEIEFFSPVSDDQLPAGSDGLYIGGGFPEEFLAELSANQKLKESISRAIQAGLPTYAECGGLMYLTEEIIDQQDKQYPMVGLIPGTIQMQDSLQAMGYVEARAWQDSILLKEGSKIRGHQFHYSKLLGISTEARAAYQLGEQNELVGYCRDNLLASYLHLHFATQPAVIDNFIAAAVNFRAGKER
ncbi:MAG: cobyrinate a,c-diamide synthase [Bacillota bacterium]